MPDLTNRKKPLTVMQFRAWAREQVTPEMCLTDDDYKLVLVLLEQAYFMGGLDAYLEELGRAEKARADSPQLAARTRRAGKTP